MRTIGFRAEPSALNWAVVEGPQSLPISVAVDVLKAPASYDEAASLTWFRDQVHLLIDTYLPTVGAVRTPETFMPRTPPLAPLYQRSRLEGVVIEALKSRGVDVMTGPLKTISKNLGTTAAKHYLESDDLRGLKWGKYRGNRREAILAAVSALVE